jgi:translation initiation factor 2 subunit 3
MSGDETLQKRHDESDSEDEEDEVEEQIPVVDVDISKLHPLSPEVISKQVCVNRGFRGALC